MNAPVNPFGDDAAPPPRPRRSRQAARVILLAGARTFLFQDTDPGVPGSAWWVVPGGGLDAGESFLDAAVRELREETGLNVPASRFIGPVARRVVWHGYSNQITRQEEEFFLVELSDAEVAAGIQTTDHTPSERERIIRHAWVPVSDLPALVVWPPELGSLIGGDWSQCVDLGEVEESTIPVD